MECSICKGAFLILFTKRKYEGDGYDNWWPGACINPYDMVRLMHSNVYHDLCVHDGEDLPLCLELAAAVDDDWCFDNQKMATRRNRKYEESICPSEVAYDMVMFNMKVDLEQFRKTFQCQTKVARDCFAHLGLTNPTFEDQYDLLFGAGEFSRRNEAQKSSARNKDTERKRGYASISHDE